MDPFSGQCQFQQWLNHLSNNLYFWPQGGAKKGAAPPAAGKGKPADPPKPKAKVWTEKDDAALRIQTKYRQYRAKKMLEKKKKDKEEYEELMDRLEKEVSFTKCREIKDVFRKIYQSMWYFSHILLQLVSPKSIMEPSTLKF